MDAASAGIPEKIGLASEPLARRDCHGGDFDAGANGFGFGMKQWFAWVSFALAGGVQVFARAVLSRRMATDQGGQLELGHARGARLDDGVWLQRLGVAVNGQGGHPTSWRPPPSSRSSVSGIGFEARVSARASDALRSLMQLAPQTARDGCRQRRRVALNKFNPRDILSFKPAVAAPAVEVEALWLT